MESKAKNKSAFSFGGESNIEAVISAPLVAASKANAMMVSGQTRFLLDYCFTADEKGTLTPVMVVMKLAKSNVIYREDGTSELKIREMDFQMPLLCLLPINSLAVDSVKIDFSLDVTSVSSYEANTPGGAMRRKAALNVRLAKTENANLKHQTQSESHLKVTLTAAPLPLPKGICTVIDLYTNAIQPLPGDATNNNNNEE